MNITFPPSFLGARCDVLMHIVVISMVIILPLLWYSYKKVKNQHQYKLHKNIQLTMFVILFFVVLLFEYDMQQNGGIFNMVKGSAYENTFFLNFMIYFHTFFHHNLINLDHPHHSIFVEIRQKSKTRKI